MNCCIQCRDESVSPLHSNTFDKQICLKCILVGDEAIKRLYTEAFNYMKIRGECCYLLHLPIDDNTFKVNSGISNHQYCIHFKLINMFLNDLIHYCHQIMVRLSIH